MRSSTVKTFSMCSYDKLIMLEITCMLIRHMSDQPHCELANPQAAFKKTILSHNSLTFNQNGLLETQHAREEDHGMRTGLRSLVSSVKPSVVALHPCWIIALLIGST